MAEDMMELVALASSFQDKESPFPALYYHSNRIPKVSGAVGAICRHLRVRSMKSNWSFAWEYLLRSSIFWPEVPRNLSLKAFIKISILDKTEHQKWLCWPRISTRYTELHLVQSNGGSLQSGTSCRLTLLERGMCARANKNEGSNQVPGKFIHKKSIPNEW